MHISPTNYSVEFNGETFSDANDCTGIGWDALNGQTIQVKIIKN